MLKAKQNTVITNYQCLSQIYNLFYTGFKKFTYVYIVLTDNLKNYQ